MAAVQIAIIFKQSIKSSIQIVHPSGGCDTNLSQQLIHKITVIS